MGKPIWYNKTVRRLSLYQEHKRKVIRLREEAEAAGPKTTAGYSLTPAGNDTSDQVGNLAGNIVDKHEQLKQVEMEIRIIEKLVESLAEPKKTLIALRYLEENKDSYVWKVLIRNGERVKSGRSYHALKDKAVLELAKAFEFVE